MFPDKYKHQTRQSKSLLRRLSAKVTMLIKNQSEATETSSGWVV